MDTAYTSRKMWFGLKFILKESPIQKSFFYPIKQVGFWTRARQVPHLSTHILFLFLNFLFVGLFHDFFKETLRVLQIKLNTWKGNKELEIRCDGDTSPYAENWMKIFLKTSGVTGGLLN